MTQEEKIVEYLRHHNGITSLEAFQELYITRLSAKIYNLKVQGYKISKIREQYTNKNGDTSYYDRYFIDNLVEMDMIEANMNHIPRLN